MNPDCTNVVHSGSRIEVNDFMVEPLCICDGKIVLKYLRVVNTKAIILLIVDDSDPSRWINDQYWELTHEVTAVIVSRNFKIIG